MSTLSRNNRFSVLMDKPKLMEKEIIQKQENKFNSFKTDKQTIQKEKLQENKQRHQYRRQQENDIRRMNLDEKIKLAKENEVKILTNDGNFPELKSHTKKEQKNQSIDHLEVNKKYYSKLLNITEDISLINDNYNEKIVFNEDGENVPDGCICIKFDKKENKIKWNYGKELNSNSTNNKKTIESVNDDYDNPYVVMSRLIKLNKIRRNDYIRNWGIDEYEYMFMFPNYDYEYYNKVDEVYDYDFESDNNTSPYYYEDYEY